MSRSIFVVCVTFIVTKGAIPDANDQEQEALVDLGTMIWLERGGIGDPEVPNSKVHQILKEALNHDNPKIFNCAVGILGWHIGVTREERIQGDTPRVNRELGVLPKLVPDLYDLLVELWENGWESSGGEVPSPTPPALEVLSSTSDCFSVPSDPSQLWVGTVGILAHLYPGDDRVYDILWTHLPQNGEGALLMGLYEGKFNNIKDQQLRIDILSNSEMEFYWSSLAARSLGEFPAERGLETLARVLQEDNMKFGTPKLEIVEAMLKYEENATPYVSLMRSALKSSIAVGEHEKALVLDLKEQLVEFEEQFVEKK